MKKVLLLILYWVTTFGIVFGALTLYSNGLYSNFTEAESACMDINRSKVESTIDDCLIEYILELNEGEITPVQKKVLEAYRDADSFNLILLLATIVSLVMSGVFSWFMVFKRKVKNA